MKVEPLRDHIAHYVWEVWEAHGMQDKATCRALDISWQTLESHLARYQRLKMAKAELRVKEQTR